MSTASDIQSAVRASELGTLGRSGRARRGRGDCPGGQHHSHWAVSSSAERDAAEKAVAAVGGVLGTTNEVVILHRSG